MSDTYEATYRKLEPIRRLDDAALARTIGAALATGTNPLILAALVAEATYRGFRIEDDGRTLVRTR